MSRNYWENKHVTITGGTGFIGSHLVESLLPLARRIRVITHTGKNQFLSSVKKDLEIIKADLSQPVSNRVFANSDIIFHLASHVAGIHYNVAHPAEMFRANMAISLNVLEAAKYTQPEKILLVSSACVYPRICKIPIPESAGFQDEPEPTNLGYGWAKRMLEKIGLLYHQENKLPVVIVRPFNAYGPRATFDPLISHVIPGLIRRTFAGENPLLVWGSGKQIRSFIFVADLVRGIILAAQKAPLVTPINLSSEQGVTMLELAKMIVKLSGVKTKIVCDITKPDGQPIRIADVSIARKLLNFQTKVSLSEGLKKTILWYRQH